MEGVQSWVKFRPKAAAGEEVDIERCCSEIS